MRCDEDGTRQLCDEGYTRLGHMGVMQLCGFEGDFYEELGSVILGRGSRRQRLLPFLNQQMAKCGIGLAVRLAGNGMFQVDDVTPNSPSQLCGFFKKGDLITSVNGISVIGFTMEQFVDTVLGPPGSDITVRKLRRPALALRSIAVAPE